MTTEDYNFEEMGNLAMNVVDDAPQEDSKIDEVSSIYKLDDELLKEEWDYDSTGIYIHFNKTYQAIGVEENREYFLEEKARDDLFLWVSRNLETKKKIEINFKWAIKTSDGYDKKRGFAFNETLDIGDEKILKDLNKKVSFSGNKNSNPSSEDSYVTFVDDFTSKIIDSNCLEVFKELDYEIPEYPEDDESFEDNSDVINSFSDYPEDIQHEVMKILNDGVLFEEIQASVSLTHEGHNSTRDALILSESSLFVGDGVHSLLGGDSGEGKSDLAFSVGYNFPTKYVKILRNISPKNIYYDCENYNNDFNILIFDDLPLTEDMVNILKELSDNTKKVKGLKTVINGKSETFTLEGKFVVILTYAKEVDDDELANRLLNLGVTIIDKVSEKKVRIKSRIRDNVVIGGNNNLIFERNRLIIQASIHYLIEQNMKVFNPFLSIYNPEEYNNRDVNHLGNMVKAKTFFEYPQRKQIKINDDLAITIGAYQDFEFAHKIWAKDSDAQKYKLNEKQKLVLKVMENNNFVMSDEDAISYVEKISKKYYDGRNKKAQDVLLKDECTNDKLIDLTGIKKGTMTNILDRNNHGTSKSLLEHKLVGKIKLNDEDRFSKVIYYKRKNEGESSNDDNGLMLTLYFQNTKEKNPSFATKKIIIDLLYFVNIVINERGYTYLKNYCDNYDKDIDVESYDSLFDFIQGFFNGFKYDEYSIDIDKSSHYDLTQMNSYKEDIYIEFEEKKLGYTSSHDDKDLTKEEKIEENPSMDKLNENSLCKSKIQSDDKSGFANKESFEEIGVEFTFAHRIYDVLSSGEKNFNEITLAISDGENPDDVIEDNLPMKLKISLKRLVENEYLHIIEPINQAKKYQIAPKLANIFEGDDD